MASDKAYLDYVLGQLSLLGDIRSRAMMGEFIIYYRDKVAGGIYDNRFLVKQTKFAREFMPDAALEEPYEGAKPMLLVDNIEDAEFLRDLFEGMYNELPAPKKKKKG
ncbi:MAG: TfoX/Sxy family protein [Ruminococcus sp.]|nr:TfoX/Sxy family protein [Ruminococcus sp.]